MLNKYIFFAIFLLLFSCNSSENSNSCNCKDFEKCENSTCVAKNCEINSDCGEFICKDNLCINQVVQCIDSNDCFESVCRDSICVSYIPCFFDVDCNQNEFCNGDRCLPKVYCQDNKTCENSVCRSNQCTILFCGDSSDCGDELEICSNGRCISRDSCQNSEECNNNQKCLKNYCWDSEECYNWLCDVENSESCIDNSCLIPDLCVNFDCSEFENVHCEAKNSKADCFCNPNYMINEDFTGCIEIPSCIDDDIQNKIYEAKTVTKEYLNSHHICPQKDDYFRIYLNSNESLIINVTFLSGDIDIYLYDSDKQTVSVASSVTENLTETITYQAVESKYHYLRVAPYYTTDTDYQLEIK
ncbi:PPC domain-containing protein [bacterium]|nr:PPC domain-containing protein [bacterium]